MRPLEEKKKRLLLRSSARTSWRRFREIRDQRLTVLLLAPIAAEVTDLQVCPRLPPTLRQLPPAPTATAYHGTTEPTGRGIRRPPQRGFSSRSCPPPPPPPPPPQPLPF